jgi:hypothetical protein
MERRWAGAPKKGAHGGNFEAERKGGGEAARLGARQRSGDAEGVANLVSPVLIDEQGRTVGLF